MTGAWKRIIGMATLALVAALGAAGCRSDAPLEPGASPTTPPDFALELFYDGDIDPATPGIQRLKLVLEPDRWLRVAQGTGVRARTFPLRVTQLSLPQVEQLVALMRQDHLQAEPTSPIADKTDLYHGTERAIYRVSLTAWERNNRYATTAAESAPTAELMRTVLEMANLGHLAPGNPGIPGNGE